MSEELSKKIKILSFVAMIMILFIHSFNLTILENEEVDNNFAFLIQDFISFHVCRVAVPLFFLISAYLFVFKYQSSLTFYLEAINKRIKSLVVPYFMWCFLWTLSFYLIGLIPQFNHFVNNPIEKPILLNFFITIFKTPICYQFWFIKDLFVLILIFPLLNVLVVRMNWYFILILYALTVLLPDTIPFFKSSSLLFFSLGILVFYKKETIKKYLHFFSIYCAGMAWVLSYFLFKMVKAIESYGQFIYPISVLIGMLFLFKLYDLVVKKSPSSIKIIETHSKYSFFIFAFHEPLMISIKKVLIFSYSNIMCIRLAAYFIVPIIVYLTSIGIAFYLRNNHSKLYNLLVGGR